MKRRHLPPILLGLTIGAGLGVLLIRNAISAPPAASEPTRGPERAPVEFATDGALLRPTGYREWVCVGTPLTPNDMNDGEAPFPEFHTVYISPDAWSAYRKTGAFPAGTVMVKELISVGGKVASSGNGYFMGEFVGLEVAVKDPRRFADQPGHWSYFSFGHEYPLAERALPQPSASCNACHEATAAEDYVFTQYYPVLRAVGPGRKEPAS